MNKILVSALMILFVVSCDFVYYASIRNDSGETIQVTVKYNRNRYDSVFNGANYYQLVPAFEDNTHLTLKKYDSVKLQITYEVPPNAEMQIEHSTTGWNGYPDFYYIDEIYIQSSVKVYSFKKNDFRVAFKKIKAYKYVLTIR